MTEVQGRLKTPMSANSKARAIKKDVECKIPILIHTFTPAYCYNTHTFIS